MSRSSYYLTLSGDVKCRYDEKLKIIDNIDPFTLGVDDLSFSILELPNVTIMDLVSYLILTHSFYTGQQLKAYKSLQAYKYYEAGLVQEVLAKNVTDDIFVIVCKVRHTQRTKEKALGVWIILLKDGSISSAHCTCMAGLGEVCTHVATVLFYLHARPTTVDEACTSHLASWPVPPLKNVDMMRVHDMDWSKKGKTLASSHKPVPPMDQVEICDMLRKIQVAGVSSAICRLMEPFASEMLTDEPHNLPPSLDSWFAADLVSKSYEELLSISKNLNITVTDEEIKIIEDRTREQSLNNLWFKYRKGRITASIFKAVCRTSIAKPSLTIIKNICYPQEVIFNSKATTYGLKNEKIALQAYDATVRTQHQNFELRASGFCISKNHPELGVSPDGIVSCSCCGVGCVEIKCPYLLRNDDTTIQNYVEKKYSCLIFNSDGQLKLDKSHCYYYQIQLQMYVLNCKYCDFVIWSRNCLYIERIFFDKTFCLENVAKAIDFHYYVVRPELLGRYFTEKGGMGKLTLWCLCQKPDDGRPMLKCDNDDCETQWFHFDCINVCEIPHSDWFCQNCI